MRDLRNFPRANHDPVEEKTGEATDGQNETVSNTATTNNNKNMNNIK